MVMIVLAGLVAVGSCARFIELILKKGEKK